MTRNATIAAQARPQSGRRVGRRPTALFLKYTAMLVLRLALFVWAVYLLCVSPGALNPAESFGISHGLSFTNVVFVVVVLDALTKLLPHAKIAMGSLKQYRTFHAPTARTFTGGREALLSYVQQAIDDGTVIAVETVEGVRDSALGFVRDADVLRLLPWEEQHLTANEELRRDIGRRRLREIVPVIVFWVAANAAIAIALHELGWLSPSTAMVWMLFYFLFDMVCVVAWCPLQLFMMHNRCCTTCQIFNWDAIMAATPLIFVGGWFSLIIGALAIAVLVRWELAVARHPERFDERTNASLKCANCQDALCYLRAPLTGRDR